MKGWTTPNYTKYRAETKRRETVKEYVRLEAEMKVCTDPAAREAIEKQYQKAAKKLGW